MKKAQNTYDTDYIFPLEDLRDKYQNVCIGFIPVGIAKHLTFEIAYRSEKIDDFGYKEYVKCFSVYLRKKYIGGIELIETHEGIPFSTCKTWSALPTANIDIAKRDSTPGVTPMQTEDDNYHAGFRNLSELLLFTLTFTIPPIFNITTSRQLKEQGLTENEIKEINEAS